MGNYILSLGMLLRCAGHWATGDFAATLPLGMWFVTLQHGMHSCQGCVWGL